jgi:zinc protease
MTPWTRPRIASLVAAIAAAIGLTAAPQAQAPAPAASAPLGAAIPPDPQITIGTFPNGLRYYIRTNQRPERRAELRLVVNAGSILEEDDQLGLAHFVEHMAFNGTKNFAKQEIVAFMESIGMRFGPSLNAFTSFDETVYMLQVPTDKPEILERAFLILEDWAHNVSFDAAEIDKERGVIVEEWRAGRGASARIQDQQFPVLLHGARYADRLPIGKKEIIETFKHDRLKQFYADWYRPDLMAVVAVGDFERPAIEALIKKHFAPLPAAAKPKPRPAYPVPDHAGTLYTVATDKEASGANVSVYSKMTLRDPATIGSYRRQIVESLFTGMLSARFAEIAEKPGAPFLSAYAGRGLFVRTKEASMLGAAVKEDAIAAGLEALFTEAERVTRHGFTATELDREKRNTLRAYEQALTEKDTQQSAGFAAEYIRNYTQREPIPGIAYEYALHQRFLPEITLAEINSLAREWTPDGNRVVLVSAPLRDGVVMPTEETLARVMTVAATKAVEPYVDKVGTTTLMETAPARGSIVRTAARGGFGITEWELSNGARVVLKPTTHKEDQILVRGFSPGGTSLASDAEFIPADSASSVISAGGLGRFSALELGKVLTGKVAQVQPYIDELEEGILGSGSRKDLETLFQLIHLTFTQPRADRDLFGVMTSQTKIMLANRVQQPDYQFLVTRESILSQNHFRTRPMTPELIDQMDLDKSLAFYRDRFADASDFTFVFVGSFDEAAMRPYVEQYLASLPALGRKETWKNVGIDPPQGVIEKRVDRGIEPKSRATIAFTGAFQYDQTERVAIRALAMVLENRLREILREDLGGTYSVSASAGYTKHPDPEYRLSIDFGCSPDRTEALLKAVFQEIDRMKSGGPTEKQTADIREALLREFETNIKQNGYLLTQISGKYEYGEAPETLLLVPEFYRKLTPAGIQTAAKTYLDTKNYVQVTLFPEKKG